MTGKLSFFVVAFFHALNLHTQKAQEAMDFGIVDGILEKRPAASEADRPPE